MAKLKHWNELQPGSRLQTSKKLLQVGAIIGQSEKNGASVLRLHWVNGENVSQSSYETAQYEVYEIVETVTSKVQGQVITVTMNPQPVSKWKRAARAAVEILTEGKGKSLEAFFKSHGLFFRDEQGRICWHNYMGEVTRVQPSECPELAKMTDSWPRLDL